MKPTRSELFLRRRADADRLVECFTYGSISDVLDELQQQVWHENPDEIDWKSSLPSPHVPVDAITSLRVTLLAEALLVPREYEFRLAVVCLLLERGAQPCRHTENGRAIEAVLEQLPPSQQEGDYLWHLRHVLDIAVDCRLNRERFLISKHAPFVAEWIDEQLALLEQLETQAESAATANLAQAEDATPVDSEPILSLKRLSDSPLHDYDDLPDYEDVDTEMAEQAAPSMSDNNADREVDAGQLLAKAPHQSDFVPSSSTESPVLQPAAQSSASLTSQSALPHSPQHIPHSTKETPTQTAAPSRTPGPSGSTTATSRASRLPASVLSRSGIRLRTRPTPSASVDPETPKRAEAVPAPQPNGATRAAVSAGAAAAPGPAHNAPSSVTGQHDSTTSAPTSATPSSAKDLPRSFWLHGLPDITPSVLKYYLSSGPTTFLTATASSMPFLQDLIGFGSFPAPFVAGAPLPPVPVEVRIQQFHEQRHVFEYGPRVGHVVYASGEAAKRAREMFDGQRMFPEEIPATEKIRWKEQAPRV